MFCVSYGDRLKIALSESVQNNQMYYTLYRHLVKSNLISLFKYLIYAHFIIN